MAVFYLNEVLYTNRKGYNSLAKLFNQIIQSNDEEIFISFARTTWFEANLCAVLGAMISLLGKRICTSIFEVFENARTHGKCQWIHTCGQYYPQKHSSRFDITIVDAGQTIHKYLLIISFNIFAI